MPKLARFGPLPTVAALLISVVVVASCGASQPSSLATSGPDGAASPSIDAGPSAPPAASDSSEPSEPPASSGLPTETDEPATTPPAATSTPAESPADSATPTAEAPSSSPASGAADACTVSNDGNRDYLVRVADSVDWPLLCAVLPSHWIFRRSEYHLARGGRIQIEYDGPGGAGLVVQEGGFCSDPGGCVPAGTDLGDAALGPLSGTLIGLDDGGFAIVVDRGATPSWLMVAHGLDQATAVTLGAAMVEVGS